MECALFLILFVVIYIITVVINMYITHKECKPRVFTLGELFDRMEGWMFIPGVNTAMLFFLTLCLCIYLIIKYTGIIKLIEMLISVLCASIDIIINCTWVMKLWDKIRNIKL